MDYEFTDDRVTQSSPKLLMQGLGEILDDAWTKAFVRTKLIEETAQALRLFAAFPQIHKFEK